MPTSFYPILTALAEGSAVPVLGPGALRGVVAVDGGQAIPADSDSLILAMNDGKPMAPKLMYEFPRAAMNVELKRGRGAVTRFLDKTYRDTPWSESPLHRWLAAQRLDYVVDLNRDTQLQGFYAATPHLLVTGVARIGGADYRYRLFHSDNDGVYREVDHDKIDTALPVLFKPLGTPLPVSNYIASDADFVDYVTELMGGFAIPPVLKQRRIGRRYLFLGLRLTRDTERMLLSEITYNAATPAGWALIAAPTDKERRFLARLNIELIEADAQALLAAAAASPVELAAATETVGC